MTRLLNTFSLSIPEYIKVIEKDMILTKDIIIYNMTIDTDILDIETHMKYITIEQLKNYLHTKLNLNIDKINLIIDEDIVDVEYRFKEHYFILIIYEIKIKRNINLLNNTLNGVF